VRWLEDVENDLRQVKVKRWRQKANTIEKDGHLLERRQRFFGE
jgi:hypothetical protein